MNKRIKDDSSKLNRFLAILLSLCLMYFVLGCILLLAKYRYASWFISYRQWPCVLAISLAGLFMAILLYQRVKDAGAPLTLAAVFLFALLPRLMLGLWITYIPASDFTNYYNMELFFREGQFDRIAAVAEGYGISEFTGLSVLNGLIAFVSPTVYGYMTIQALMTALIAALIALIGRQMDGRVGVIAGLAFALYPSNIVMTQVTSNQHWSALIGLAAVYCLIRAIRTDKFYRAAILAALTGLLTGIGQFAHPSTPPVIVAYAALLSTLLLRAVLKHADWKRAAVRLVCFLLVVTATKAACYGALEKAGLYHPEEYEGGATIIMNKLLYRTNAKSGGSIDYEDTAALFETPRGERLRHTLGVLLERVKDVRSFSALMLKKPLMMWCFKDNAFDCYLHGLYIYGLDRAYGNEPYDLEGMSYQGLYEFIKAYSFMDFLFVALLYALALCGVFLLRKRKGLILYELCMWLVLGWISVHELIEIQSRYRYYAMPYVMLLAAMGLCALMDSRRKKAGAAEPSENRAQAVPGETTPETAPDMALHNGTEL